MPFFKTGSVPLPVVIGDGGTGQTTKAAAFDALSPMTTGGDIIYGGASGTGTRLANGTSGQVLQSAGGTSAPVWSLPEAGVTSVQTTTYPILTTDNLVLLSGASGSFSATLPTAVGVTGKRYKIKRVDLNPGNIVTIATTSSQTIDGSTTFTLMTQYEYIEVESDGSNWHIIDHFYLSKWVAYTPTFTGYGTVSGVQFYSRRDGDSLEIIGSWTAGTPTATEARITIGYSGTNTNVTTSNTIATNNIVGTGYMNLNQPHTITCLVSTGNTYFTQGFVFNTAAAVFAPQNGNTIASVGQILSVHCIIPISNWQG